MTFFSLIIIYFSFITGLYCQYCQDGLNQMLDWYVIYKIPNNQRVNGVHLDFSYVYMTNDDHSQGWRLSSHLVNQTDSLPGSTLGPFYHKSSLSDSNLNYILYNDQPPDSKDRENFGHAKGTIGFNSTIGFWLIHSVPHFPPFISSNKYDYPDSAKYNGQSFLCITFNVKSQLSDIIEQLLYIKPYVYDYQIDNQARNEHTVLNQLIEKQWRNNGSNYVKLTSWGSTTFSSFSKSPAENVDLYTDIVSEGVRSALFVETWRRGDGDPLPSNCSNKYAITNVQKISIQFSANQSFNWKYTEDHSKWAIGVNDDNPIACIGDINRMRSQFKRGGGAVCFNNSQVWKTYLTSVVKIEKCKKTKVNSLFGVFKLFFNWMGKKFESLKNA